MCIRDSIWTHTGMDKWMYNWMSVSSSLWMWECLFILLYPHTYFWMLLHTYTFTHKCICIRIYIFRFEWMFIHRSHQVSLCASITMIVCKKISDYQSLPNISEIFPNISQHWKLPKTNSQGYVVSLSKPTRSRVAATEWQTYPVGTREIPLEIIPGLVRPYFPKKIRNFHSLSSDI